MVRTRDDARDSRRVNLRAAPLRLTFPLIRPTILAWTAAASC